MNQQVPNLLIVEDEPITRSQLATHFEKEGYHVYSLEDAHGADELISENNIELCLIDINLPGKDGLTLTRELRSKSDIGIILVTVKMSRLIASSAWKVAQMTTWLSHLT